MDRLIDCLQGDCLEMLPTLEAQSVQCCITSPPYWGLRDYGTATWEGGKTALCDHLEPQGGPSAKQESNKGARDIQYREHCPKCGARRIDSQLGLETTPELYVANMVRVFREVWRVLRDDGTLWLNLGDSYADNRSYQVTDNKHVDVGNNGSSNVPAGQRLLAMDRLTHLDLCSGIGGFHLAAEWAGFITVGFSEIEPYCCKLLEQKWPTIPNYGDLRRADFTGLRGTIDVLSAGVPCQPASCAGKRRGKEDDRWLWEAVLDVVGSVEPAWCLFENPPGILTLGEFDGVLLRLESLGYEVRMFSVPANAIGAKHRRQRVFIMANRTCELLNRRGNARSRRWDEPANGGEALADADQLDGNGAGHGTGESSQFATRSIPAGFRLTESPLCGATSRVPNRSHRLKALGNSVVPQCAYPFFAAIAEVEKAPLTDDTGTRRVPAKGC